MKAAFFEVKSWERRYLEEKLLRWTLQFDERSIQQVGENEGRDAECGSVFIYSRLDETTLSTFPALKMVATRSTGYDHIDVASCRRRGIVICNVPSYGENTVAEHTFALILMLSRKVHQSHAQVREGHVERARLTGFDLQGKTFGIIGAGHIGLHAIRIGRGFGMRVLAYDVRCEPSRWKADQHRVMNRDANPKVSDSCGEMVSRIVPLFVRFPR
jgi:D-lactate dehydrogenase